MGGRGIYTTSGDASKPTYAILCNFDQFWVYDFNIQVDEQVE
jgi:hypothetical protein